MACLVVGMGIVAWSTVPAATQRAEIEVGLRNSRFEPSTLQVRTGTTVRFVIRNNDPIDHEFLLGDESAHDAHEHGTEAAHGTKPGEVSVPAFGTATTTFRFDEVGVVLLGCHLPGHWDHGMRGVIIVVA